MNDKFKAAESIGITVDRGPNSNLNREHQAGLSDLFMPQGVFHLEHWRKGEMIGVWDHANTVVTQGKNSILEVYFRSATQITSWYMGLVNNTSTPTFAAGDTAAQIGGSNDWVEMVAYSGGARKAWSPAAASGGSISNTSVVAFNITGTDTLFGAFIVSASSGTGGVLWAGVAFPSTVAVASSDDIKVTYTLSS